MKYQLQGLVDPKEEPFDRVLPFEVQVKIMFWFECFVTIDKRKKLQASHNTSDRINGGTKWWFVFIFPEHPTVTTVIEYSTTSYR